MAQIQNRVKKEDMDILIEFECVLAFIKFANLFVIYYVYHAVPCRDTRVTALVVRRPTLKRALEITSVKHSE